MILGQEDPLEKGMATHSSIPAWSIPWKGEPGGLQSGGLQSQTKESEPPLEAENPARKQEPQSSSSVPPIVLKSLEINL